MLSLCCMTCLTVLCTLLQVQALQQAVIKIGEHMGGNKGSPAGNEEKQGAETDADVKDDKK